MQIPVWRTAGTRYATCVVAVIVVATSTSAQINSWINPGNGNWDQSANWSLGVRPNSSQSVMVTNSGSKTVALNGSTPINFPESMTVNSLTVQGAADTLNTLVLDNAGTALPLTVLNGITLRDNARILDLNSALVVQGGAVTVTNAEILQGGGFVRVTNAQVLLSLSRYKLTNGVFQGGVVLLDRMGRFSQYGGISTIQNLGFFATPSVNTTQIFTLYNGIANFPAGLRVNSDAGNVAESYQFGGTNYVTQLSVQTGLNGPGASYTLTAGLLGSSNVSVLAGGNPATFTQSGGNHIITNALELEGTIRSLNPGNVKEATYVLTGGTLRAAAITLRTVGSFVQNNGVTFVSGPLSLGGSEFVRGNLILTDGMLGVSNVTCSGGGVDLLQIGGSFFVTNTLSFGGNPNQGGVRPIFSVLNGTLSASNVEIFATMLIDSGSGRISNPGFFRLGGSLIVRNINEMLGRFILASNSVIDYDGNNARLSFASSSGEIWQPGATLVIADWNGSFTGGGSEQLRFGTDQSGLTAAQLSQIRFRIGNDLFTARILSTGEVVPDSATTVGFVNSWINPGSGNWDVPSNWSLGVRPNSLQSVFITNTGWKAVAINPSTPVNFPESMTVNDLTIRGAFDTRNTLLLNFAGTTVPLTVSTGLTVADNAQILNFNSGLVVRGGTITVTNAEIIQAGGFVLTTNAPLNLIDSEYDLTNGFLEAGVVNLGLQGASASVFTQDGGTNSASDLAVSFGTYVKNGGDLFAGDVRVFAPDQPIFAPPTAIFTHAGGTTTITNDLRLVGLGNRLNPRAATFNMLGGSLSARRILLEEVGVFAQSNGIVKVTSELIVEDNGGVASRYYLSGGNLFTSASSISSASPEPSTIIQSGGTHIVTNTLSINGIGIYQLSGGTVTASNIVLTGTLNNPPQFFVVGAPPFSVTNQAITLNGGAIVIQDSAQRFGRLTLTSDSGINLAGSSATLRFADSRTNSWGARLSVFNWNGSTNGGGADQLIFGTNSSALTASQLAQIDFINPAGFPPGTNHARILATGEVVPDQTTPPGGVANSWVNPSSGNWDVPANWSLGVRPNSSQSVSITNSGWKAVAINPSTPVNFPESMTVNDLTVRGAFDTRNTLLLNYAGTAVPLTLLSGLTVADNAQILNFNSGLVVQGGTVTVTNAQIVQDGGFIRTTNAPLNLFNSEYHLTNGVFEAGSVAIGLDRDSHFNQYGGTATITNLSFPFIPAPGTGTRGISLYGGTLNLPGGMRLEGRSGSTVAYFQAGGTNRTTEILLEPGFSGPSPDFTLNGGLLADNNVTVIADTIITTIEQNGGTHVVSNTLQLAGGARTGVIQPAVYALNGGALSARVIDLSSRFGDAVFIQSNGVAQAVQIQADGFPFSKSEFTLAGGTLSSSNLFLTNGANMHQYGGALVVSNSLSFTGFREPGPRIFTRYEFLDGTLSASNLNVGGDFIIGNGSPNRISNPGTISLSHLLQISNAIEQLGRFVLASNATINLAGTVSRLSFANSSGQVWTPGATLVISNWNGSTSGGGAEQVRFGTNQFGLTAAQLSQVQFRIGNDLLSARILATGEVVPEQLIPPSVNLEFSRQGNNLVLTWPEGWLLQSATNVLGPYIDAAGATSPYTNNMTTAAQRFFRLRLGAQ